MKFSRGVVKSRIAILILALILMVPSVIGMVKTRVNYDMLTYLPSDMETVKGQNELLKDFNKGAFTFLIFENMPDKDVAALKEKVEKIEHVDTVLWYDSVADLSMPKEFLPEDIYKAFNSKNSTMMAVFFDTGTSDDRTMSAVKEIRKRRAYLCRSCCCTIMRCNASFPGQLARAFCVPGIYRCDDIDESGIKLFPWRDLLYHKSIVCSLAAGSYNGLLDIPLAQL